MLRPKIIGMAQAYNELSRGYFFEIIDHYTRFCDHLIILDDASTDGTKEKLLELESKFRDKYTVLTNDQNNWQQGQEVQNKILLHSVVIGFDPDLVISFDFDEFYSANTTRETFNSLYHLLKTTGYKAASFPWLSLWLDKNYYRVDKLGQISPPRVWMHEKPDTESILNEQTGEYDVIETGDTIEFRQGLHQQLWPTSINPENTCFLTNMKLLHFSSVELKNLIEKVKYYKKTNPKYDPTDLFTGDARIMQCDAKWFTEKPKELDWSKYVDYLKFAHEQLMNAYLEK